MSRRCAAIVLAAGAGTRMSSDLPKPLHPVAGRAMVLRVLDALDEIDADPVIVVIGHGADQVQAEVTSQASKPATLSFAHQDQQLGTGDAAAVGVVQLESNADPACDAPTDVVILPGDTPLLRSSTVAELVAAHVRQDAAATILTSRLGDPTGYGRLVRAGDGSVVEIVEQRDATPEQVGINEINAGVYCFAIDLLRGALGKLQPANAQAEYYLTDVIGLLARSGAIVTAVEASDHTEALGVNDPDQLASCTAVLQARTRSAPTQQKRQ